MKKGGGGYLSHSGVQIVHQHMHHGCSMLALGRILVNGVRPSRKENSSTVVSGTIQQAAHTSSLYIPHCYVGQEPVHVDMAKVLQFLGKL